MADEKRESTSGDTKKQTKRTKIVITAPATTAYYNKETNEYVLPEDYKLDVVEQEVEAEPVTETNAGAVTGPNAEAETSKTKQPIQEAIISKLKQRVDSQNATQNNEQSKTSDKIESFTYTSTLKKALFQTLKSETKFNPEDIEKKFANLVQNEELLNTNQISSRRILELHDAFLSLYEDAREKYNAYQKERRNHKKQTQLIATSDNDTTPLVEQQKSTKKISRLQKTFADKFDNLLYNYSELCKELTALEEELGVDLSPNVVLEETNDSIIEETLDNAALSIVPPKPTTVSGLLKAKDPNVKYDNEIEATDFVYVSETGSSNNETGKSQENANQETEKTNENTNSANTDGKTGGESQSNGKQETENTNENTNSANTDGKTETNAKQEKTDEKKDGNPSEGGDSQNSGGTEQNIVVHPAKEQESAPATTEQAEKTSSDNAKDSDDKNDKKPEEPKKEDKKPETKEAPIIAGAVSTVTAIASISALLAGAAAVPVLGPILWFFAIFGCLTSIVANTAGTIKYTENKKLTKEEKLQEKRRIKKIELDMAKDHAEVIESIKDLKQERKEKKKKEKSKSNEAEAAEKNQGEMEERDRKAIKDGDDSQKTDNTTKTEGMVIEEYKRDPNEKQTAVVRYDETFAEEQKAKAQEAKAQKAKQEKEADEGRSI